MDIIFFAEDWGRHPSTAQFIAQELLKNNRIIWVESLGLRRPNISIDDFRRVIKKITKNKTEQVVSKEGLFVLSPLVIPYHSLPFVRCFNNFILRKLIKKVVCKCSFKDYALVVACPSAEGMIGKLGETKSIYYCADEYSVFPGMDKKLVTMLERGLLGKVDTVIVTSQKLKQEKSKLHPNVQYLPHGVQYKHFARCQDPDLAIPNEIQSIPKPIIGYHGLIQDLIDFPLIKAVATEHPDWSFVFIGNTIFDVQKLLKMPNIYYIGAKEFHEIPSYVKGFDVGIIPYKINTRTIYANPIKLREYLAAGKPVVSTPLPEVFPYADIVGIAANPTEFEKCLKMVISTDNSLKISQRMNAVKEDDWQAVAKKFEIRLSDALI